MDKGLLIDNDIDIKRIKNDTIFHSWHNYAPSDAQYVKYAETNTSLIAVGRRIEDTYCSFCDARAYLLCYSYQDYGDFCEMINARDVVEVRSRFLTSSIIRYAICKELAGQTVWAYLQNLSLEDLVKGESEKVLETYKWDDMKNEVKRRSKDSTLSSEEQIFYAKIKDITDRINGHEAIKMIWDYYIYLKHGGAVHYKDAGDQDDQMLIPYNGSSISLLKKPEYEMETIKKGLCKYHFEFEKLYSRLIGVLIPTDFLDTKVSCTDYQKVLRKMYELQNG